MDAPVRQRLAWRQATVTAVTTETSTARSLHLEVPNWSGHRAGQHLDVRLTAEDGYHATRSYSLSSGPCDGPQITVERVDDGEVSPFLVDVVETGDTFEVRGPIGGYFVWSAATENQPLLLLGGGSGIAPLRAIWRAAADNVPVTLLYSARSLDRVIFADELGERAGIDFRLHLTRQRAPGFASGHITAQAVADAVADNSPAVFVCGPTAFVESMAQHLLGVGVDPQRIRTERFG